MTNLYRILSMLAIITVFVSCASAPRTTNNNSNGVVDVETFSVALPNTSDWTTTVDRSKRTAETTRVKQWWTGKVLGSTMIKVFENRVTDEGRRNRTEQEVAYDFLGLEEKLMAAASQEGRYKLESTARESVEIDGKTFYTLAYKIKQGRTDSGFPQIVEAVLYVWFPPNFSMEGKFYGFLISEAHEQGSLVKVDLNQIVPVIESFAVKP